MASVPATAQDEDRTVNCVWFTGAEIARVDWLTGNQYTLRFDPGGADLSLLNNGAPVLDNHSAWGASSALGKVEKAWVEGGQYLGTLRFSKREGVDGIWTDIRDGILSKFSMGVELLKTEESRNDKGTLISKLATKWRPFELSVTPLPADFNTTTLAAGAPPILDTRATCPEEYAAMENITENTGVLDARAVTVDAEVIKTAAVKAEREQRSTIRTAILKRAEPFVNRGQLDALFVETLANTSETVDEGATALMNKLAEYSDRDPVQSVLRAGIGGQDERDKRRLAMTNAMLNRCEPGRYKLDPGAREYRGLSLLELAKDCLAQSGDRVRGMSAMEVATNALNMRAGGTFLGQDGIERLGALSTSDFPFVLANVANKFLLAGYAEQVSRWREICRQRNAADFKAIYPTAISAAETFELVPENTAFKLGKLSERRESFSVKSYGKLIPLSRQMIVNDDMGAFQELATAQGMAAARTEADIVWALITSNPTMVDTYALFSTEHANLTGSGTAISVDSIGVGRKTMGIQTGLAGETLNIEPEFLVVSKAKEQLALQYTSVNYVAATGANINPWAGTLKVIAEGRLDAATPANWYLFANPAGAPVIMFAYLEGNEGVYLETKVGFEVDGLILKGRIDFGAGLVDWRGAYKNAGT